MPRKELKMNMLMECSDPPDDATGAIPRDGVAEAMWALHTNWHQPSRPALSGASTLIGLPSERQPCHRRFQTARASAALSSVFPGVLAIVNLPGVNSPSSAVASVTILVASQAGNITLASHMPVTF
jgi:hypothetical protein